MRSKNKIYLGLFSLTNGIGGAEKLLYELSKLSLFNSNISFIAKTYQEIDSKNNHFYNLKSNVFVGIVRFLIESRQLNDYQIIFSSHVYLNALIGFLKRIGILNSNVKLVFRESTSIFLREKGVRLLKYKLAYSIGYGYQDLIITQSELMKQQLLDNLPKSKKWNIKVFDNPINLEKIIRDSNCEFDITNNFIVSAGRLIPEKGFDILIKAYSLIHEEIGNLKLIILGEGNERKKLEGLIGKLGLSGKVKLFGFEENPMTFFKHADLCVVSSRIEGFPNVLLQMMTLNGNVVSTLCAGGIDNLAGVQTCETNNVNTLAKTMLNAINIKRDNSKLFKKELESRSVENYWNQIESYLNET